MDASYQILLVILGALGLGLRMLWVYFTEQAKRDREELIKQAEREREEAQKERERAEAERHRSEKEREQFLVALNNVADSNKQSVINIIASLGTLTESINKLGVNK